MPGMYSRIGSWSRLLSVAGIAVLALVYLGAPAALATGGQAPTITSASDAYFHVGAAGSFTVTTSGSPAPTIQETGTIPTGLTFVDNGDGTATLSGTATSGQEGDHPITIKASNGILPDASQAFTIEVGCAVVITSANSTTFTEGEAGTFHVTGTTTCGGTIVWSETGALPSGVTLTDQGNAGATLAGTPGAGTAGSWPFTIHASDGDTSAVPQSFTLTVRAPLVVISDTFSSTEGANFTHQVGHFTGGNGPFTATIDWGDGSTSGGTVVGNNVTGSHTYAEEGSKNVKVSVTDAGTTKSSTKAELVADAVLNSTISGDVPVTANEGATFTGFVGSFVDQDPNGMVSDYTATVAWGDGSTSPGTVTSAGEGGFNVTGTHSYQDHGVYSGTVTITDVGGAGTSNALSATIAEVNPIAVTGKSITATAGVSFTGQVATFTDPGGKEPTSDYVTTINWGDGTTSTAGTVGDPPGTFTVSGTHTYAAVGTYTITVGAREADGAAFVFGTGSAAVSALPATSAPQRPLPYGFLLIAALGLLLLVAGTVARRRPEALAAIRRRVR